MRKWVITGGAGVIGCHAAARLHAAGRRVVLVDNLSRRGAEVNLAWLRPRGVADLVWADIRDSHAMHGLLARHADADAVLHLAAQIAVTQWKFSAVRKRGSARAPSGPAPDEAARRPDRSWLCGYEAP